MVLWFLQLNLITPYYRNAKINSVQSIADTIENLIENDQPLIGIDRIARENAMCLLISDEFEHRTIFNGIGSGCYVLVDNLEDPFNYSEFHEKLMNASTNELSVFVDHGSEMLVFGRSISPNLGNFTILINARITPEKTDLILIQNQFVLLVIIVLVLATFASLFISRRIAKPFISMTDSARQLANGNFDVKFDESYGGYNEFVDLATTLNYATKKLSEMDEMRMDLIANVSHDIRTPLTMILAYSEMITDFSKDDQKLMLEHLEVIRSEALYLDELVKDILELSAIESGKYTLNKSRFSLNQLVERVITHFPQTIHFTFDKLYIVEADEMKINQVLYNLVNNAIKHSKANHITVNLKTKGKKVFVEVIDDGIGIDAEVLSDIWERYNKVNKNFFRDANSTGLGLSIAKGIVHAHNEHVGAKSVLDEGTTFYFTLTII